MPAACYFAWGCFRYFGARTFEGDFSNVTRSYAGKGTVRMVAGPRVVWPTEKKEFDSPGERHFENTLSAPDPAKFTLEQAVHRRRGQPDRSQSFAVK